MQKKLLVLAIAALASTSAFADSTTTFYGLVDAGIVNVQATGLQGGTTAVSGGLASSRFGVKNVEDLDGGLKAVVVLEYYLDTQTNNTIGTSGVSGTTTNSTAAGSGSIAARQQMLALAGEFGTVATGYLQTTAWDFGSKYNVVAGSDVSPLGNLTKGQGFLIGDQGAAKRADRAIAYISPSLSGLTVAVNYTAALGNAQAYGDITTANGAADSNITASLVSANYDAGPLSLGLVYAGTNSAAAGGAADTTEYALGVAYSADVAKITATYQTSKHPNAVATVNTNATSANTVYSVGVAVPVVVGTVVASYAGSTINNLASGAAGANATSYAVGFLKPLSKTTTAYLAYSATTQGNGTSAVSVANDLVAPTAGGNSSIVALGLSKKF
jgi:predicted porin